LKKEARESKLRRPLEARSNAQAKLFDVQDLSRIHGLIREHALGTLILQVEGQIYVDHLPFVLETPSSNRLGLLRTHAARDNPFWAALPDGVDCTVVFTGPNAYISPSWYPSRRAHGRVQPSWYGPAA
jgi:transcriptional regulator